MMMGIAHAISNSCGLNLLVMGNVITVCSDVIILNIERRSLIFVFYISYPKCYLATNATISVKHTPLPGI
jgi:hypothetical protein